MAKYGVDNVSKLQSIKNKKLIKKNKISNLEIFINLRNIFISNTINLKDQNIDEHIKKELKASYKVCYNYWLNLTDEQKDYLLDKIYSSLESRVTGCLDKLNFTYVKRFMIGRKFFDIKIKDKLIDVNSDLWHANPNIYKGNDTLKFPFKSVKAKVIWERDKSKKELAESDGYEVYYIWESDIKDMSDDDLINYLVINIL